MDKRKYKRAKHITDVRINTLDRNDIVAYEGEAIDISGNGMLVRLNKSLSVGTGLDMIFVKPNSFNTISCFGRVVRNTHTKKKEYNIGINFSNFSRDDERNLDYYLFKNG